MTEKRIQPARPPQRRAPRPTARAHTQPRWLIHAALASAPLVALVFGWAIVARQLAPTGNTTRNRFDTIIVLGTPADSDGNPTPMQLARVSEGVREYQRGVAPRLIMTGGAAHNQYVEAAVMARTAEAEGIPASAIFIEPSAKDTIQNACYSERIMLAHGWNSAEVISGPNHLPRAGLIFSRLPLQWRVHAAPSLGAEGISDSTPIEILKTLHYLVWSRQRESCDL